MGKLYTVFTDHEHDKVGIPEFLFYIIVLGILFVIAHTILFMNICHIFKKRAVCEYI